MSDLDGPSYLVKQLVLREVAYSSGSALNHRAIKKKSTLLLQTQEHNLLCAHGHLSCDVAINEFIDRQQRLRPLLVRVPGPHLDGNSPAPGHGPQVLDASWRRRSERGLKKAELLIRDSTIAQKYIICAPLGVFLFLCHQ